jgi:hypothetical protein
VIDRGTIDWIVSNRSIETNNAQPDERFAIVGRNLALILKGSQTLAGGLTARAHPRSRFSMWFPDLPFSDDLQGRTLRFSGGGTPSAVTVC